MIPQHVKEYHHHHPFYRRGFNRPRCFTTFVLVVTISSIWQSSRVPVLLSGRTAPISNSISSIGAEDAPTVLGDDDPLSAGYYAVPPPQDVPSTSELRSFPRLVYWNNEDNLAALAARKGGKMITYNMTLLENIETANNGTDPFYREFEKEWYTKCLPVETIPVRPTCNSLHELMGPLEGISESSSNGKNHTEDPLLSMEGSWRSVWKTKDPIAEEMVILKRLHLHRDFDVDSSRAHEMDIKVMERLTASSRVVSAYGFCGQSVMTQFAHSSGSSVIKNPELSWRNRLIMGHDLAQGLAELHALEPIKWEPILQKAMKSSNPISFLRSIRSYRKPPVFAHNDINVANTVSVLEPNRVQWNDFNLGMLSQYRKEESSSGVGGGACPVPVGYEGVLWRSPEEIRNTTGHLPSLHPADVYAFGTLLYTVFTKHQPWTHLEEGDENPSEEEIAKKKLRGDVPNLPPKYQPERLEAKVLWAATKACFRKNPEDRPTAFRLAVSLGTALGWIQSRKELSDEMIQKMFT